MQACRMDMLCTNWLVSRSSGCQASAAMGLPGIPSRIADFGSSHQNFQGMSWRIGTCGRLKPWALFLIVPILIQTRLLSWEYKQLCTHKGALPDSVGSFANYTSKPYKFKSNFAFDFFAWKFCRCQVNALINSEHRHHEYITVFLESFSLRAVNVWRPSQGWWWSGSP